MLKTSPLVPQNVTVNRVIAEVMSSPWWQQNWCFLKGKIWTNRHTDYHAKMKTELVVMFIYARKKKPKIPTNHQKLGEKHGTVFLIPLEGTKPISDF